MIFEEVTNVVGIKVETRGGAPRGASEGGREQIEGEFTILGRGKELENFVENLGRKTGGRHCEQVGTKCAKRREERMSL